MDNIRKSGCGHKPYFTQELCRKCYYREYRKRPEVKAKNRKYRQIVEWREYMTQSENKPRWRRVKIKVEGSEEEFDAIVSMGKRDIILKPIPLQFRIFEEETKGSEEDIKKRIFGEESKEDENDEEI